MPQPTHRIRNFLTADHRVRTHLAKFVSIGGTNQLSSVPTLARRWELVTSVQSLRLTKSEPTVVAIIGVMRTIEHAPLKRLFAGVLLLPAKALSVHASLSTGKLKPAESYAGSE